MKIKGKPRETLEVNLGHGVIATVAYLTRKDASEINNQAFGQRWDAEAGKVVPEFDTMSNLQERMRRGVPAVSGLTVEALLALAEVPPHVELDAEVGEGDVVAWDHDRIVYSETVSVDDPTEKNPSRKATKTLRYTLPMYLYSYGPRDGFAARFEEVQVQWRTLHAEREKKSLRTPESSPE